MSWLEDGDEGSGAGVAVAASCVGEDGVPSGEESLGKGSVGDRGRSLVGAAPGPGEGGGEGGGLGLAGGEGALEAEEVEEGK